MCHRTNRAVAVLGTRIAEQQVSAACSYWRNDYREAVGGHDLPPWICTLSSDSCFVCHSDLRL